MDILSRRAITKIQAIIIAAIVIVAIVAAAAYYLLTPQNNSQAAQLIIGCPLPLTGSNQLIGQMDYQAMLMLANQINAAGGVLGKNISLVTEDTQSDPGHGLTAVDRLIHLDNAFELTGTSMSGVLLAAGGLIDVNNITCIGIGESNPRLQQECGIGGWPYIFTQSPRDDERSLALVQYIINTKKETTFSAMCIDNDWGRGVGQALVTNVKNNNGTMLSVDYYLPGEVNFNSYLTKVISLHPDAFIMATNTEDGSLLIQQAAQQNVRGSVKDWYSLGSEVDNATISQVGAAAIDGLMEQTPFVATSLYPQTVDLNNLFKTQTGTDLFYDPALAYWSLDLLVMGIRNAGVFDRVAIRDAVAKLTWNYLGVANVTWDEYNHVRLPQFLAQVNNGTITIAGVTL